MTKSEILLTSGKTIFTIQDIAVLWNVADHQKVVELIKYYSRKGTVRRIRRGLYALTEEYIQLELAQKIIVPSYITFHTALSIHGINYQYYSQIHSSALVSRTITVGETDYIYHKIPDSVLYNDRGLIREAEYLIAGPERALCESLLFAPRLGFDNLDTIDVDKLLSIAEIYNNKRLVKRINTVIKNQIVL